MNFELTRKDMKSRGHHPLLSAIVTNYSNQNLLNDDSDGFLVSGGGNSDVELTEPEIKALLDTLKTLRAGGWFAQWLEMQVQTIASGNQPDDKHPSPLKIAGTLVDAIDQYEKEIETAREMIARRPDVLIPIAPAPQHAAQSTQSPRKSSARAHSKRSKATTHADAA